MNLLLSGKVAVVTGGSSGIGLATVRILLEEGADVALCARDAERLATVAAELAQQFGADRVRAVPCDVCQKDQVEAFVAEVVAWRGRCDLLINNAGQGRMSTFADTSDEDWRNELDLKFFSQINPIRAFKPLLDQAEAPAIVAVNSLLAYQPESYMVCTSAARAGVQNLLKSLAGEFAPSIRVNSVVLGLIDSAQWERRFKASGSTDRPAWFAALAASRHIPLGRLGRAEEVARAIVFLASPIAAYITGAQLEVSGGQSRFI